MPTHKEIWTTLSAIDVSGKVDKKGNLSYLSWAWAWSELMKHYPDASYVFEPPVTYPDNSVEVWVRLSIGECSRAMWLPVMDHRNNSVINPTSRQVSDTRMRCLTKCMAMFGLGHYIYAGEDLPDPEVAAEAARIKAESEASEYAAACDKLADSIQAVKDGIASGDISAAAEAWFELDNDEKASIWKAPTKGGCFTVEERKIIKSAEFRESYYGKQEQ